MKRIRIARLGLVAAGLAAAVLATKAQAQEGELVKGLLGAIGVIDGDKEQIDYRERPPLVLPPRMDLREPAAPGSVQARNPQWPNDPDVVARKRQAVEDRTPITQTEGHRMNGSNTRLSIHEMRSQRSAGAGLTTSPQSRTDSAWMHPDTLRHQHVPGKVAEDDVTRRSLTEPPSAYRRSASGKPIKSTWEAPNRENEADPKVFLRQQAQRRGQ